jgi:hypothetical protein
MPQSALDRISTSDGSVLCKVFQAELFVLKLNYIRMPPYYINFNLSLYKRGKKITSSVHHTEIKCSPGSNSTESNT